MMTDKTSKALAKVVETRIKKAQTQIAYSRKKIQEGKPLDAERDENRKICRVARVMGVTDNDARDILQNKKPAEAMRSIGQMHLAESIQGGSIDYDPIVFLESGRTIANAVARVRVPDALATGFLISPDLFITNNHVINTEESAAKTIVEFNYEEDRRLAMRQLTRFQLDPTKFYWTSKINDLDYTVVGLGKRLDGPMTADQLGYIRLSDANDKHTIGERANIIEHPNGDPKQIALRENRIVARLDDEGVLLYETDTEGGASGSPVLNEEWEAIALHHWGGPHRAIINNAQVPDGVNEGIRISKIVGDLKANRANLKPTMAALLDAALALPQVFDRAEAAIVKRPLAAKPALPIDDPMERPQPAKAKTPTTMQNAQEFKFTIPIEIAIRIPGLQATTAPAKSPAAHEAGAQAEGVHVDPNYENRNGYKAAFIPGWEIPLPTLKDDDLGPAARLVEPEPGEDPNELRYQNFSIVMNAKRRMAYFTACNIDGAKLKNLNRDGTEAASESLLDLDQAEASETWYLDPRLSSAHQAGQEIYSNQKPQHLFDRGHQVRRLDPVWGRSAVRANADTFHFCNCCPQAAPFNQGQRFWAGIENYVLQNADEEDIRVNVYTGPIFEENDAYMYRGVLVPKKFFKIVARVEDGVKKVTAFLADQSQFLDSLPEALVGRESFDDTRKVREFISSVQEIEDLTHVDFGELRDFDTAPAGGDEASRLLRTEAQLLGALNGAFAMR